MFKPKIYVVLTAAGTVVGLKLTHEAAIKIARDHAPAEVLIGWADKDDNSNPPVHWTRQMHCNQLQTTKATDKLFRRR